MLQLEPGRRYETRDGREGVIVSEKGSPEFPMVGFVMASTRAGGTILRRQTFKKDGRWHGGADVEIDFVKETQKDG